MDGIINHMKYCRGQQHYDGKLTIINGKMCINGVQNCAQGMTKPKFQLQGVWVRNKM